MALDLCPRQLKPGKIEVRVRSGIAVAGEVLDTCRNRHVLQTANHRGHVPAHQLRLRAERSHTDHRIRRVCVDIGHRRKHDVRPSKCDPRSDHSADRASRCDIVKAAKLCVSGKTGATCRLQSRDIAAFFVDTDEKIRADAAQLGREASWLSRVILINILREVYDAGEPVFERTPQPVRNRLPHESWPEHAINEPYQRWVASHGHPLTAPATRPPLSLR